MFYGVRRASLKRPEVASTRVTRYNTPGLHTVYVYYLTWYDIAGGGGGAKGRYQTGWQVVCAVTIKAGQLIPGKLLNGIYPGSSRVLSGSLYTYNVYVSSVL